MCVELGFTVMHVYKCRFYIEMVTITELQTHWRDTRCIYCDEERQVVPEKLRKYVTPGKYSQDGFTFLKFIIPYFDKRNYYVTPYDNVAFYLLTTTPITDDITKVFDKCNMYNVPMYDVSNTLKDLCSLTMQCRTSPGYYGGYNSDEDYDHNSFGRTGGAQFIYALYNTTNAATLSSNHIFNALRFIFTHPNVFNCRYMYHCYHVAGLNKHLFSKKQWLRLSKEYNENEIDYDDGEQDLSTDPYEMSYCSDCSEYGHPSWMCSS